MLKFTKMHGLENDYVYMNAISQTIENRSELAKFVNVINDKSLKMRVWER
jgi:diaminopimelate epimerase